MLFTFLCSLLVISVFKMVPEHGAEELFSVSKCKKAVMRLAEKMHVLDKLSSGMNHSAVDCEFSANEININQGPFKQKQGYVLVS